MASFGSYEDYNSSYMRPTVHTKSQLHRRYEDVSQHGNHYRASGMQTINTVNLIKGKENINPPRMKQGKNGVYSYDHQDFNTPSDSLDKRHKQTLDTRGNHRQGFFTQQKPDYDSFQRTARTVNRQAGIKMNDNRALVPIKDLQDSGVVTPRLPLTQRPQEHYGQRDINTGNENKPGGMSSATRLDVLTRNKQLIYVETVWTKKRLEKLRSIGFGDHVLAKKLKSAKEEKRWDMIMRFIHQEPGSVNTLWEFIKIDFPNVYSALSKEYQAILRNHFKPQIANLQTTPANANRMLDILVDQSEEYDQRMFEMEKTMQDQANMLEDIRKVMDETRKVVFDWGGRDLTEDDQQLDLRQTSKQVLDTVTVVLQEKDQLLEQEKEANEELRKKAARLSKAKKEKP